MKAAARCRPTSCGGFCSRLPPSWSTTLKRGPVPIQWRGKLPDSKSKVQGRGANRRTWVVADTSPTVAFTLPDVVALAGVVRRPSAPISPATPSRLQAAFSLRRKRPRSSKAQASKATGSPALPMTSPGTISRRAALASAAGGASVEGAGLLATGLEGRALLADAVDALFGREVDPAVGHGHRAPDLREAVLGGDHDLLGVERLRPRGRGLDDQDLPDLLGEVEPAVGEGGRGAADGAEVVGPERLARLLVEGVEVRRVVDDVDATLGDGGAGESDREPVGPPQLARLRDVARALAVDRHHPAHGPAVGALLAVGGVHDVAHHRGRAVQAADARLEAPHRVARARLHRVGPAVRSPADDEPLAADDRDRRARLVVGVVEGPRARGSTPSARPPSSCRRPCSAAAAARCRPSPRPRCPRPRGPRPRAG